MKVCISACVSGRGLFKCNLLSSNSNNLVVHYLYMNESLFIAYNIYLLHWVWGGGRGRKKAGPASLRRFYLSQFILQIYHLCLLFFFFFFCYSIFSASLLVARSVLASRVLRARLKLSIFNKHFTNLMWQIQHLYFLLWLWQLALILFYKCKIPFHFGCIKVVSTCVWGTVTVINLFCCQAACRAGL